MSLLMTLVLFGWFAEPQYPTTLVYPPFGHCMGIYRAGTEQLAMLLGGFVRFDDPQSLACVKLDSWDDPGTSDDDELAVYGVNSGSGHIIYNADMYTLGLYGGTGPGADQLSSPHGIAVDPFGLVLVADTGNGRVVILKRSGSRLLSRGTLRAEFVEPWDVALDGSGRIYVTDRAGGLVYLFDSISDSLPETVEVDSPSGIDAVGGERWFHEEDEEFVVVVAEDASSLLKLEDGRVTGRISVSDMGGQMLNYPAIDFWGNVWVTDSIACCIHKLTDDLEYLTSFGTPGHGDREFWYPTGITIWKRYGQVFVAEREGARYFWIGVDLVDLSVRGLPRGLELSGTLTENALIQGLIYGPGGDVVHRLAEGRYNAGPLELQWDGCTDRGIPVQGGDYTMEMVLQPVYSSKGYFSKTITEEFTLDEIDIYTRG